SVIVYANWLPAGANVVVVVFVIVRSADAAATIVVTACALLLPGVGSNVLLLAVTVSLIVPDDAVTLTTSVNDPFEPLANDAFVQVIGPFVPTVGVVQLNPAGPVIDWKRRARASGMLRVVDIAASGPAFVTLPV